MSNLVKITELPSLETPDANTENSIFLIVDRSTGTDTTKQISLGNVQSFIINQDFINASFDLANTVNLHAEAAFSLANTVNTHAEASFTLANTVNTHAEAAFAFANTVNIHTEAAFTLANTVSLHADAAYDAANGAQGDATSALDLANNVNTHAEASFTLANTVSLHADAAFDAANTVANALILITTSPTTPLGQAGDLKGQIYFTNTEFYYCTSDYDGATNVWSKITSTDSW